MASNKMKARFYLEKCTIPVSYEIVGGGSTRGEKLTTRVCDLLSSRTSNLCRAGFSRTILPFFRSNPRAEKLGSIFNLWPTSLVVVVFSSFFHSNGQKF